MENSMYLYAIILYYFFVCQIVINLVVIFLYLKQNVPVLLLLEEVYN